MSERISPHFRWAEAAVSSLQPRLVRPVPAELQPVAERLAFDVLEPTRVALGRSMRTLSWYRPVALNLAVGGSPTSQHLRAEACDWTCLRIRDAWVTIIELVQRDALPGAGQMIYYPTRNFIHQALPSSRFKRPTLCVHDPARGLRYTRHAPTIASFELLVPATADRNP
jgi:hypothetical protein